MGMQKFNQVSGDEWYSQSPGATQCRLGAILVGLVL